MTRLKDVLKYSVPSNSMGVASNGLLRGQLEPSDT